VGETASAARVCLDAVIQVAWWRRSRDVTRLVERGLGILGELDSSTRAGLLAVAGMTASQTGGYERGEELLDEALAIATRQRDDWVIGLTLYARATHHFSYQEFREAVEAGSESIDFLRRASDVWNLANILGYVGTACGWLGRFEAAAEFGAEGEALAHRLGNWSAFAFAEQARGFHDIGAKPANDELDRRGRRALDLGRDMGFVWLESVGHSRLGLAAFWRGDWTDALAAFELAADLEGGGSLGGQLGRLLLIHAYLGHRDETLDLIERARPQFPSVDRPASARSWNLAATAVEAFRLLGERDEVAELYPTMSALAGASGSVMRAWDFRLVATLRGIAAGCGGEWEAAEAHFEEALGQAKALPMLREEPEAQRFFAQMLLDRNRAGDRERAAELLETAREAYTTFGMPRHAALTRDIAANI
jgi:tetratricopeptide (TPR) repeat protein